MLMPLLHAGTLTQYSITVHTSELQQAMTNAERGFAVLHGSSSSSREVLLTQQDSNTFQAGCQDTWSTPEMQDLRALQKLTIGLKDQVSTLSWLHAWTEAQLDLRVASASGNKPTE